MKIGEKLGLVFIGAAVLFGLLAVSRWLFLGDGDFVSVPDAIRFGRGR